MYSAEVLQKGSLKVCRRKKQKAEALGGYRDMKGKLTIVIPINFSSNVLN